MIKLILPLIVLISLGACTSVPSVEWISTTGDRPWNKNEPLDLVNSEATKADFIVNTNNIEQEIDGFGGCFNELGWDALKKTTTVKQKEILHALFDSTKGCRFTICRMPIGANDYAVDWYSHNETAEDYQMAHFSIDRDKQRLIPYIKEAQKINPSLKIWASPWCPPAWMKSNGHYACNSNPQFNDLPKDKEGQEMVTQFRMEPNVLGAYALYFEKFVRDYQKEGIPIYAIHVQNEMNSCQSFPSCVWRPEDIATFISHYLGPQFAKNQLNTEIWLGTVERPQIERMDTILSRKEVAQYIRGVGFQWAGKGAIPEVHKKYPNFRLMQTETECGNGSNDWAAAVHTFSLMNHYFNNGANAYMYWNMVLNETGKSQWGWKQNSMITIDSSNGKVTYNPEFYLMKHLSAFVPKSSHFIKADKGNDSMLAFKTDKSVVLLILNDGNARKTNVQIDNQTFTVQLAAKSINTFQIKLNQGKR